MLDVRIVEALEKIHESTVKLMQAYRYNDETIYKALKKKSKRVLKLMEPTDKRWN